MESEPAVLKETPPPDSVFYIFRNESAAVVLRGAGETEMLRGLRQPKHYNVGRTQEGRQMSSLIQRALSLKGKITAMAIFANRQLSRPPLLFEGKK